MVSFVGSSFQLSVPLQAGPHRTSKVAEKHKRLRLIVVMFMRMIGQSPEKGESRFRSGGSTISLAGRRL